VDANIPNEQIAVERAFNERISGRAPEKRGNGLKYVKAIVTDEPKRGLACCSGKGSVEFGDFGKDCAQILRTIVQQKVGTITLIEWGLNHENRN
jgi:hypothetical protein